jgi:DNA repair photolyase
VLRVPWEVAPLFRAWLDQHLPERAERVMARVRDMRGGKDYDADFAHRMKGQGLWAELIAQRVRKAAARHGLPRERLTLDSSRFRPPPRDAAQQTLF